jgi:hypothetical protein
MKPLNRQKKFRVWKTERLARLTEERRGASDMTIDEEAHKRHLGAPTDIKV